MRASTLLRGRRAAVVVASTALAAGLSACATPQYPVRPSPTPLAPPAPVSAPAPAPAPPAPPPPAPPPAPADPDAPRPAPSTPIQSAPLAPIGQAGRATQLPPIGQQRLPATPVQPDLPVRQPASLPPIGGGATASPSTSVGASPWVKPPPPGATPGQVVIGPGETLFDVAERVRTPVRAIIEANGLQPPYQLPPGATLIIPPPLVYSARVGDSLFGIARRFSIDPRSLANLNGFSMEAPIRGGQAIALPALARDQGANLQARGASPVGPGGTSIAAASPPPPRPARASVSAPSSASLSASNTPSPALQVEPEPPAASDAEAAAAGRGRFAWPLRGDLLSRYGPKGLGQRNDGVNIAASAGEEVKAAAAGEVVFAGELPSFGNLVLVKHAGGWVTAYAHLSKIEVKMREAVSQGQELGQVGQTGMVDRPQLHFEIRYAATPRDKARPVDPAMLLPRAG